MAQQNNFSIEEEAAPEKCFTWFTDIYIDSFPSTLTYTQCVLIPLIFLLDRQLGLLDHTISKNLTRTTTYMIFILLLKVAEIHQQIPKISGVSIAILPTLVLLLLENVTPYWQWIWITEVAPTGWGVSFLGDLQCCSEWDLSNLIPHWGQTCF